MESMIPLRMTRSATSRRRTRETTPTEYREAFVARVKSARVALGMSQQQMADALGIPQDHYKHFEGRSVMPTHLVAKFCEITGMDPWYMLTGQSHHFAPRKTFPAAVD